MPYKPCVFITIKVVSLYNQLTHHTGRAMSLLKMSFFYSVTYRGKYNGTQPSKLNVGIKIEVYTFKNKYA